MNADKKLSDATVAELTAAIKAKQQAAYGAALSERHDRCEAWLSKIDALLELVATHGRTTCSDENPFNNDGRCTRCTLLEFKRSDWWDNDYTVEININRNPVRSPE